MKILKMLQKFLIRFVYINILLSKNFNRSDLIIGVGGGITGDVTGFVASIFKRGINFINIPTTLLAQVDSAIGGKTGVNSNFGKNLVGSFYQPKLVISDTSFINSLPRKEIICGYAEILKHAIIRDKVFFKWLKNNSKSIFGKNSFVLIDLVFNLFSTNSLNLVIEMLSISPILPAPNFSLVIANNSIFFKSNNSAKVSAFPPSQTS